MLESLEKLRSFRLAVKMDELTSVAESADLFAIAYLKAKILAEKIKIFSNRPTKRLVVITNPTNYGNVSTKTKQTKVEKISETDFVALATSDTDKLAELDGAVLIMTNNNVARISSMRLLEITKRINVIVVVHDFDNHHWHQNTLDCCLVADLYAPAHSLDCGVAARINPLIIRDIPCGTLQWSKQFLTGRVSDLIGDNRVAAPLGMHTFYPKFKFRNAILTTVNQTYPSVGLLQQDFHGRDDQDRWNEWISYPVHWIAPVSNDLPIRFFDALITGGIPLVPSSLRPYLEQLRIPENYFLCYTPLDLLEVKPFVEKALKKYTTLGVHGRVERHLFALENFHVDEIISKLYSAALKQYFLHE
jgi:hypothetical protein